MYIYSEIIEIRNRIIKMLTSLILKLSVPGYGNDMSQQTRVRCGIVCGITGIVCNIILIIIKFTLAFVTGSIAIAADAVNNLSDAGSGVITIAGFHISSRPPDEEHPFGHGRTEYVAGLVVALLVVVLGATFLKDSITSLFRPKEVAVSVVGIVILSLTVAIKCWMFFFYLRVSKLIKSDVVKALAYDSLSDCLGTLVVIASLILAKFVKFPFDGCAGIIVASMILWAGISVLKDTVSKLLGEPPDYELVEKVKKRILECPGIDGVHDMIVHNYGENSYFVTAHAEISCEGDRFSAHDILEYAEVVVAKELSVNLLLHGDPYDKNHSDVIIWRSRLENIVAKIDSEMRVYDFRLEKNEQDKVEKISFHLLIPYKYGSIESQIHEDLQQKMRAYQEDLLLSVRFVKSFV